MSTLYHLNMAAYHTVEAMLCDVKLVVLKTQRHFRLKRIAKLEAELARRRSA